MHVGVDMSRRMHSKESLSKANEDWSVTGAGAAGAVAGVGSGSPGKAETQQLEVTPPVV